MLDLHVCLFTLTLLAAYFLLSPRVAESFYRIGLFKPYKYPNGCYELTSLEGVRQQDVFFKAKNGNQLHAWYFYQPRLPKTILIAHGNTGNLSDLHILISLLLRTGCSVFVFDYQGYGRSKGSPSVRRICDDALASYDYLVNQMSISSQDIVVYGESMGASVAAQASTKRHCAAIILQSGFSSLRRAGKEANVLLHIYPTWLFPYPFLDTLSILKRPHAPLLILHGEQDSEIPIAHADELYTDALEPKTLIRLRHTAHAEIAEPDWDLFVQSTSEFLQRLA